MSADSFRSTYAAAAKRYNDAVRLGEWNDAAAAAEQASLAAEGICDTLKGDGSTDLMAVGSFWIARAQLYATRAVSARLVGHSGGQ